MTICRRSGLKGDEQLSGLKVVDDTTFTVDLNQSDSVFPIKVGYSRLRPAAGILLQGSEGLRREASRATARTSSSHWDHNNGNRPGEEP